MSYLYVLVPRDEIEKVPINFVGVHPIRWHYNPKEPQVGFREIEPGELEEIIELARSDTSLTPDDIVDRIFLKEENKDEFL